MFKNLLRHQKIILYSLERNYGLPCLWFHRQSTTKDVTTGKLTVVWKGTKISRSLLFDEITKRKFIYDLSYIAANKNFSYGAFFDPSERLLIVRSKYLKTVPVRSDHMEYGGSRYEIVEVTPAENIEAYTFKLKSLPNYEEARNQ